jgi:ElaB/YqjD/DUF883 family membrane-anchored ribosome-binding protein
LDSAHKRSLQEDLKEMVNKIAETGGKGREKVEVKRSGKHAREEAGDVKSPGNHALKKAKKEIKKAASEAAGGVGGFLG